MMEFEDEWFRAVTSEDVETVTRLLKQSCDVNMQDEEGRNALHHVAYNGNKALLEILLANHADINAEAYNGETPLVSAILGGQLQSTETLLVASEDAKHLIQEMPLLHLAAMKGHLQIVDLLLLYGADPKSTRSWGDFTGLSVMHDAVQGGRAEVVQRLIEAGGCVNAETSDGSTPLHKASFSGNATVMETLLNAGAYIHKSWNDGKGYNVLPFHLACENDHIECVKLLIKAGSKVNKCRTYESRAKVTALHMVVRKGNAELTDLLIQVGSNVDAQDSSGFTALHHAAICGHVNIARSLVAANCALDPGAVSHEAANQTPLHMAIRNGNVKIAKLLLDAGCKLNEAEKVPLTCSTLKETKVTDPELEEFTCYEICEEDVSGYAGIHWATDKRDLDMVKMLCEAGCDINQKAKFDDNFDVTALHLAAQDGCNEILQELINAHADVNAAKRTNARCGLTPLHQAVYNKHLHTVELLLTVENCQLNAQTENGFAPLHYAAQQGDSDIASCLIKAGARVSSTASFDGLTDVTPLHLASQNGHESMVQILVEAGSDVNACMYSKQSEKVTSLHLAATGGHVDTVRALIRLGCDVSAESKGGFSALHLASQAGHIQIVKLLLEAKVDVNQEAGYGDNMKMTSLHVAAQEGHTEVAETLIKAGTDCNATRHHKDRQGITPLHLATENGHWEMVSMLIQNGCDADAQDSAGFTPLHLAVQHGFTHVAEVLLRANCNMERRNSMGVSPYKMAVVRENDKMADLLLEEQHRRRKKINFDNRRASIFSRMKDMFNT